MKWIAFIISISLITACGGVASEIALEEKLQSWKGKAVTALFEAEEWGYPPDELVKEEDTMIYVYHRSHEQAAQMSAGRLTSNNTCIVKFEVQNDIIAKISVEGTCRGRSGVKMY